MVEHSRNSLWCVYDTYWNANDWIGKGIGIWIGQLGGAFVCGLLDIKGDGNTLAEEGGSLVFRFGGVRPGNTFDGSSGINGVFDEMIYLEPWEHIYS